MPREARLFTSSAGSAVRGYLKYRANIPPRWIKNARGSRKRIEPEIAEGFRSLERLRIRRPRARVAIRGGGFPTTVCDATTDGGSPHRAGLLRPSRRQTLANANARIAGQRSCRAA